MNYDDWCRYVLCDPAAMGSKPDIYLLLSCFGNSHHQARAVQIMLQRKLSTLFEKDWLENAQRQWAGPSDADRLIHSIKSVVDTNSTLERAMNRFYKPVERWPLACLSLAFISCIEVLRDSSVSAAQLTTGMNAYQDWFVADSEWRSARNAKLASELKPYFQKYSSAVTSVLESVGYSPSAISSMLTQTEFSPNPQADSENERFQVLKTEGNDLFRQKDFKGAISKYSVALQLKRLSDDSRSVLHSNRASCLLELGNFELARMEAKKAIKMKPVWFKPWLWYFRACNGLRRYISVLGHSGLFPNAFPQEWHDKVEDELRIAIDGLTAQRAKTPVKEQDKPAKAHPMWNREFVKRAKVNAPTAKWEQSVGTLTELRDHCFNLAIGAGQSFELLKINLTEAIDKMAKAVLLGRGLIIPVDPFIGHAASKSGVEESRNCMIVRILAADVDSHGSSLNLCNEALRKWPSDWWFLEKRATLTALHLRDFGSALSDIMKAVENAPEEDLTLQWLECLFTWYNHQQIHSSFMVPEKVAEGTTLITPMTHVPLAERVPPKSISGLLAFVQKAPSDHPQLACTYFELAHMYFVEEQIELAQQFYDSGLEYEKLGTHEFADSFGVAKLALEPRLGQTQHEHLK